MKRNNKIRKTISARQFITEFGEDFTSHMKQRLLELGDRCVFTRGEENYILDLKHIEHLKYDCNSDSQGQPEKCQKEPVYGQLIVNEGNLYFSGKCLENSSYMQASNIGKIYAGIDSSDTLAEKNIQAKKVDDTNIDYVVDNILDVCPEVSPEHLAIIAKYSN